MNQELMFDAVLLRKTSRAMLLDVDGEEAWIPYSEIIDSDLSEASSVGDDGYIIIPRWLAKEKGLSFD